MPTIDITAMLGMRPRVESFLLPDENAEVATNCHFDTGIISPLYGDTVQATTFPSTPATIFRYTDAFWFAWTGDVDAIRSPIAQDDYDRVYYTDGSYPKVTNSAIATGGATKPTAYFRLGIPAPLSGITFGTITPPVGETDDTTTDDETRYYVHTYVSAMGEEGPPSPASAEVNIPIPGSSIVLNLPAVESNNNNITLRRIYRSATTDSSSGWYLVGETAIATTAITDALTTDQLGAELETEDYLPPPATMKGLCLMANGIAAGFDGNTILFSGAYLPYAWPEAYQMTTEDDVVAICPIGTSLVVGTKGYPYVLAGVTPAAITSQKLMLQQACISKRSMVAVDGVVLYASPDGLVGISESTAALATEQILSREQWLAMHPSTLRAWAFEGKYIGLTDNTGFIYDPKSNDFCTLSNTWNAAFNDMKSDALFIAKGTALYTWRSSSTAQSFTWRSKKFIRLPGMSYTCARVVSSDITKIGFKLYVDGVLKLTLAVGAVPASAFRLPVVRGDQWQIEITGTAKVSRITFATSMAEIANG